MNAWFDYADLLRWLEQITFDGACPALVNDDNGHWAVAFDGTQNVPDGDGPEDIMTSFFIARDKWYNTIGEAIEAAKREYEA